MKNTIKCGVLAATLLGFIGTASAGEIKVYPLINTTYLFVTNAYPVTNLLSYSQVPNVSVASVTNAANIIFKNNTGDISQTGTNTTFANFNLLGEVDLWSPNYAVPIFGSGNSHGTNTYASVAIRLISSSGTLPINFSFTVVPDGTYAATSAGKQWVVGVTPAASAASTYIVTNIPDWLLTGAKKFRLQKVDNTDTGGVSGTAIYSVDLIGARE